MIGRYKLLEKIGEGGFGEVWMAEQREPVKRRVALKIIKLGMDSRQIVARFEAERQALAMMDHANIAKIFDAGRDRHRPALLRHGIGPRDQDHRILRSEPTSHPRTAGLFILVCQAIQHAHQKGIIHRDIKPSNIGRVVVPGHASTELGERNSRRLTGVSCWLPVSSLHPKRTRRSKPSAVHTGMPCMRSSAGKAMRCQTHRI